MDRQADYQPAIVAKPWHTVRLHLDPYIMAQENMGPYEFRAKVVASVRAKVAPLGIGKRQVFTRHGCVYVKGYFLYVNVVCAVELTAKDRKLIKKVRGIVQRVAAQVRPTAAEAATYQREQKMWRDQLQCCYSASIASLYG